MISMAKLTALVLSTVLASSALATDDQKSAYPAPDSPQATRFGYANPDAALAALKERTDVVITQQGKWTIVDDKTNSTYWSFTTLGHPAHPAAVKRVLVQSPSGDVSIMMTAKCGASKSECDKLIAEFRALNERVRQNVSRQLGNP